VINLTRSYKTYTPRETETRLGPEISEVHTPRSPGPTPLSVPGGCCTLRRPLAGRLVAGLTQTNNQLSARVLELEAPTEPTGPAEGCEDGSEGVAEGQAYPLPHASHGPYRRISQLREALVAEGIR
jgi:hypothetical protein